MEPSFTSLLEKQSPSESLNAVVDEFVYRKIILPNNSVVTKEMPCRHVNSIDFFLAGSYDTYAIDTGKNIPFARCTIRGPRTYKKYRIEIKEDFVCFSIRFKPTGIYQLLGIPMNEFCDEAIDVNDVVPFLFHDLIDQLMNCNDLKGCKSIAEPFLLKQLVQQRRYFPAVARLADLIRLVHNTKRISELYQNIPVSGRHLERNFTKEVGVSPKVYSNLIRFEKVVQARMKKPSEKWSSIVYEFNYFDQMHLIKDFKRFLDITPTSFQPANFAF